MFSVVICPSFVVVPSIHLLVVARKIQLRIWALHHVPLMFDELLNMRPGSLVTEAFDSKSFSPGLTGYARWICPVADKF